MPIDRYWEMKRLRQSRKEQLAVSGAEAIYDSFLDEWLKHIEKPDYLALDRVQDGALTKLQEWVGGGVKVVLVTMRNCRDELMNQLQDTGLLPYFASVIICKHANGGVGKALEVLRALPSVDLTSCLWIGDTEADAEGARHLKCPIFLLTCGLRERVFLTSLAPDFLAESLVDVDLEGIVKYVS